MFSPYPTFSFRRMGPARGGLRPKIFIAFLEQLDVKAQGLKLSLTSTLNDSGTPGSAGVSPLMIASYIFVRPPRRPT